MDMLQFDQFTIGWGWTSDYGSPQDPEQFGLAARVFAAPQHPPGRRLPSDARDDRRPRRSRRPGPLVQVHSCPPGGTGRRGARCHPHRYGRGARHGQTRPQTDRRALGRPRVPGADDPATPSGLGRSGSHRTRRRRARKPAFFACGREWPQDRSVVAAVVVATVAATAVVVAAMAAAAVVVAAVIVGRGRRRRAGRCRRRAAAAPAVIVGRGRRGRAGRVVGAAAAPAMSSGEAVGLRRASPLRSGSRRRRRLGRGVGPPLSSPSSGGRRVAVRRSTWPSGSPWPGCCGRRGSGPRGPGRLPRRAGARADDHEGRRQVSSRHVVYLASGVRGVAGPVDPGGSFADPTLASGRPRPRAEVPNGRTLV